MTTTHVCPPGHLYVCPTAREVESSCHGGFDTCCDRPGLHVPIPDGPGAEALSTALSEAAKAEYAQGQLIALLRRERDGERSGREQLRAIAKEHRAGLSRVRGECDRIEAAVRANPKDPDFDGAYLACLRHIRTALDGGEEV